MRLPAEWERQSGVQLTWPHCDTDWYQLDKVLACYVRIASAVQGYEQLVIVTRDIEETKRDILKYSLSENVPVSVDDIAFYESPLNDTWARDHGGISVYGDGSEKQVLDFVFNGWGLKFGANLDNQITKNIFREGAFSSDVRLVDKRPFVLEGGSIDSDGMGTLLTTTECLCSLNRNEYLSKAEIEYRLKHDFGLRRVLWLDHGAIQGDDTDSHVDTLARFCSPDTIAYTCSEDSEDLKAMEEQLITFRTMKGEPYNLLPLPLPDPLYLDDYRLPATYANFLILNGAVLVPGTGGPKDEIARTQLKKAFPDRIIEVLDCKALLSGHGSLHCVTMQYPEGWLNNAK